MGQLTPGLFGNVVPGGTLLFGDGSAAAPSMSFINDSDTGIYRISSGIIGFSSNGFRVADFRSEAAGGTLVVDQVIFDISNQDTHLLRDAANTLAQRNGTSAQANRVYRSFIDASNFTYGSLMFGAHGSENSFNVNAITTGSGTGIGPRGVALVNTTGNSWGVQLTGGAFTPGVDNGLNIGQTGALRPASVFIGTSLQIEANNGLKLTNQTSGPGASGGTLTNAPSAGNPDFWLPCTINGTNHWIPAWTT